MLKQDNHMFQARETLSKPPNHELERQLCGYDHMVLLQRTQAVTSSSRGSRTIRTLPSTFFKWCTETHQSTQVRSHRHTNTCTRAHKPNWKKNQNFLILLDSSTQASHSYSAVGCTPSYNFFTSPLGFSEQEIVQAFGAKTNILPFAFAFMLLKFKDSCCPFNQEILKIQVFQTIMRYQDDSWYS